MTTMTAHFTLPPDHPALPGHFPGRPIVPGVLLLDAAFNAIGLPISKVIRAKFLAPVGPGEEIEINITWRNPSRVAFTGQNGSKIYFSGECSCTPPAPKS
jgi:3-hydroxyacyl-[acyl-carrier-protein] dehydratase